MNTVEAERLKYEKIFAFPGYGSKGHGAPIAGLLIDRAPTRGVLGDFGCGRGGSFDPYISAGFMIQPVDHVSVLADSWTAHRSVLPFCKANLWTDKLPAVDYGLCTDVMEHIPEPHVDDTIKNIARSVGKGCLWTVCHVPDVWGARIGEPLHMTVQPHSWWLEKFTPHWKTIDVLRTQPGSSIYWTHH